VSEWPTETPHGGGTGIDQRRFHTGSVGAIAAGHAVHDTYTAFLPPLLPAFIESMALTKTAAGLLYVFIQLPSLLQPLVGHLADRRSLRIVVVLGPAVAGCTMTLLGWAPGYGWLAALLVLAGLNAAAFHAVAPVLAGRLAGGSLGRGMGFWMVGGELGRTLGPLVIVSAIGAFTLRGVPWLAIGGIVTSLLLERALRRVPRRTPRAGGGPPLGQVLGRMRPVLLPVAAVVTVRSCMIASVTIFLPTFLTEQGASLWLAGAALSMLEGAGVVGALAGGWLSDRWGRRSVLLVSLSLAPLCLFGFLAVGGWARLPLILALGATLLSIGPVIMAVMQESFPENRALANGLFQSLSFLIRSLAVIAVGLVGDLFDLRLAFAASGALMLLGLPLVRWLPAGGPAAGPAGGGARDSRRAPDASS
jgi:FSR family fosmidomycin resistance protein-like MFS transporter